MLGFLVQPGVTIRTDSVSYEPEFALKKIYCKQLVWLLFLQLTFPRSFVTSLKKPGYSLTMWRGEKHQAWALSSWWTHLRRSWQREGSAVGFASRPCRKWRWVGFPSPFTIFCKKTVQCTGTCELCARFSIWRAQKSSLWLVILMLGALVSWCYSL